MITEESVVLPTKHLTLLNVFCVVAMVFSLDGPGVRAENATAERVAEAFRAREAQMASFRVTWEASVLLPAPPDDPRAERPARESRPVSYQKTLEFLSSGESWRLNVKGGIFHATLGKVVERQGSEAWHNNQRRMVSAPENADRFASIRSDRLEPADMEPVAIVVRPISWVKFDLTQCAPTLRAGNVEGNPCVILSEQWVRSFKREWWLDEKLNYLPVRFRISREGNTFSETDFSYALGAKPFPLPTGWSVRLHRADGRPRESWEVNDVSWTINPNIENGEFLIDFPPGTLVTDLIANQEYVVRDNGERRIVTKAELARGAGVDEFMVTETGQATGGRVVRRNNRNSGTLYYWIMGMAFCTAALALYLYAQRRAH